MEKVNTTTSNTASATTVSDGASATIDTSKMTVADIMSRSAQLDKTDTNTNQDISIDDLKTVKFDDIKDPVARALAEKRVKELESGFNKKYEQVANLRKQLEAQAQQSNASTPRQWTQAELDAALRDPQFVSLVQARQQQAAPQTWEGSAEEWSALTPEEKQQFAQLNSRITAQEQMMYDMLKLQEDQKLKQTFPDYDSSVVDQIQSDLLSGRVQASREHLWKVANFDKAVERAYKLGLQDRNQTNTEKFNASSSPSTRNVTSTNDVPEEIKKKGFGAVGKWRLEQFKTGKK